jgi:hypothetical protein
MRRPWLLTAVLAWAACNGGITSPTTDSGNTDTAVLIGAGDIAVCGSSGMSVTARLLDDQPGTIFVAGDIAYPEGTAEQFEKCYNPTWGRHKARTRPAPGNHEYYTAGAAPYFAYFGFLAGPPGLGYYRYRTGTWQVYSLNSNIADGLQLQWLKRELAGQPSTCSIAYFHHPLVSSGPHGMEPSMPSVRDLWSELYDAGADVIISAHEHLYERFAPQTPDRRLDIPYGIRQFVVGTGGAELNQAIGRAANSEVIISRFGVLRLALAPQSYAWEFISEGGAILDSGTGPCHGKPPADP